MPDETAKPEKPAIPAELQELLDLGSNAAPEEPVAHVEIRGWQWPIYAWQNRDDYLWSLFLAQAFGGEADTTDRGLAITARLAWMVFRKGAPGMTAQRRQLHLWNLTEAQAEAIVLDYARAAHDGNVVAAADFLAQAAGAPVRLQGEAKADSLDPTKGGGRKSAGRHGGKSGKRGAKQNGAPSWPSSSAEAGDLKSSGN